MLVVDAFEDELHVPQLASRRVLRRRVPRAPEPGALVVNFMDDDPKLDLTLQRLERAFGGAVIAMPALYDPEHHRVFALKGAPQDCGVERAARARADSSRARPSVHALRLAPARHEPVDCSRAYNRAMKFRSESFADGGALPAHYAFCVPDPAAASSSAQNRNPHLAWSDLPKGTQSVVIICHDPDVPSKADDVNKEGRTIPASLPRVNFCHWVLVDMPASGSPVRDGEFSSGVTLKGKSGPLAAARHAPGPQRLHRLVRERPEHDGRLFRLRRAVPAVERLDPASLHLHAVRARPGEVPGAAQVHGGRRHQGDEGPRARHRPSSPACTRSTPTSRSDRPRPQALAGIAFLGALVFGVTGFGAALVTIPLATHLVPLKFALALFVLADLAAALSIGLENPKNAVRAEWTRLVPMIVVGTALGVTVLVNLPRAAGMLLLGVFVLSFALLSLVRRARAHRFPALGLGRRFAGGITSTVFGAGGPPYAIYLSQRGLTKEQFRATLGFATLTSISLRT